MRVISVLLEHGSCKISCEGHTKEGGLAGIRAGVRVVVCGVGWGEIKLLKDVGEGMGLLCVEDQLGRGGGDNKNKAYYYRT